MLVITPACGEGAAFRCAEIGADVAETWQWDLAGGWTQLPPAASALATMSCR